MTMPHHRRDTVIAACNQRAAADYQHEPAEHASRQPRRRRLICRAQPLAPCAVFQPVLPRYVASPLSRRFAGFPLSSRDAVFVRRCAAAP